MARDEYDFKCPLLFEFTVSNSWCAMLRWLEQFFWKLKLKHSIEKPNQWLTFLKLVSRRGSGNKQQQKNICFLKGKIMFCYCTESNCFSLKPVFIAYQLWDFGFNNSSYLIESFWKIKQGKKPWKHVKQYLKHSKCSIDVGICLFSSAVLSVLIACEHGFKQKQGF